MVKILFIDVDESVNTNLLSKTSSRLFGMSALAFPQLYAVTPSKHDASFIDEKNKKINLKKDYDYDIIGISTVTCNSGRAYELADEFRRRGKTVVLGGWHPSAIPKEAKEHADAVIVGEGDYTWPQFLKDFENEKIKPFYYEEKPVDLRSIPIADEKILKGISVYSGFQATRGCPVGCNYCAMGNRKFGKKLRTFPLDSVIKSLKSIPQKYIFFHDSSLTSNPKYSKELFSAMKDLNKKFLCYGNAKVLAHDKELCKLSMEAGCLGWYIGFDSPLQASINSIPKPTNIVSEFKKTVDTIHDHNMIVIGTFILGFDTDTKKIFNQTKDMIQDLEIDSFGHNILTPFPGTVIFERFEKENRILTKNWSDYDGMHVVFEPKNMTPQELIDGSSSLHEYFNPKIDFLNKLFRSIKVAKWSLFFPAIYGTTYQAKKQKSR